MENSDRNRTIKWEDPLKNTREPDAISGLDYLQSIKDGRISPPPVAMLVGYRIIEVDKGHALYELEPEEFHYNPFLTVHGGIVSIILDTTMTASILSCLEKGVSCSTAEIKVNFIRPVNKDTGTLICEGNVIHPGKRLATAEGKLKDKKGNLCAHAISTCLIFKT